MSVIYVLHKIGTQRKSRVHLIELLIPFIVALAGHGSCIFPGRYAPKLLNPTLLFDTS